MSHMFRHFQSFNIIALVLFIVTPLIFTQSVEAAVQWEEIRGSTSTLPAANGGGQQTATQVFDANNDGTDEFFIAERTKAPSVVMYRKTASGWSKTTVDNTPLRIEAGGAHHDIDGDGYIDLVFTGDGGNNEIWWWKNPGGNSITSPWARYHIKNGGSNKHHDSAFGDVDHDGQVEFVTWNQGGDKLLMYNIPSTPTQTSAWSPTTIYSWSGQDHEGLKILDVNGDGKLDIVGGGRWFKHTGGTSFQAFTVDSSQTFGRAHGGQFVKGGWAELVYGPGDGNGRLKYYSYNGTSWSSKDLAGVEVDHGHSLDVADIDGDGNLDIYSSEMRLNEGNSDAKNWVFYGDGSGNFTKQVVSTGIGNHESVLGDFDGDGDLDILGKPYNWNTPNLNLWINTSGTSTPPPGNGEIALDNWKIHTIDTSKDWRSIFITGGDIDKDGKVDIISGGWWYKNPGSNSGTWLKKTVGGEMHNMAVVHDFNGDGHLDIIGTNGKHNGSKFSFALNDGSGNFNVTNNIATGSGDFLQGAITGSITNNTQQVALSWHNGGNGVELLSKSGSAWTITNISTTTQDEDLSIGNIDRNGGTDILLGTKWLQNNGSTFTAKTLHTTNQAPDRNELVDINKDGKLDAVVGYEAINSNGWIAWYEQGTNASSEWTPHPIDQIVGPMSLDAKDMDNDGDIDIVVGEHNMTNSGSAKLYVYENNNKGANWTKHIVHTGNEHHDGARTVDIDGDGDLDILSIGWGHNKVLLYENTSAPSSVIPTPAPVDPGNTCPKPGDVDCDGTISTNELKSHFRAYATNNSAADVTNSGRVTTLDLIKIIQDNENLGGGPNLPTPRARSLPISTPTPSTPGNTGNELLLYDKGGLSFVKSERGFDPLITESNANDHGPSNWLSPIDYWNGQFQVRYHIEEHPSNQAGKLQVCIWTMPGYKPETCSGYASYSKAGDTAYNTKVYPNAQGLGLDKSENWFRLHGVVDYTKPQNFLIRNVLRGASGCNVTDYGSVNGRCPDEFSKYEDMRVRITIVLVPKGQEFSGWNNYPL